MSRLHVALVRANHWIAAEEGSTELSNTSTAPVISPAQPAPETRNVRDVTTTAVSAFAVDILERERERWRRALDDVRSALVTLERTAAPSAPSEHAVLAAEISQLVNGVTAAALEDSHSAVERARAQGRAMIDDLEARLVKLEAESANRLTAATARHNEEHLLRLRAEAALADSQRLHEQVVATHAAQLEAARLRNEAERLQVAGLRRQLTACFEEALRTVQTEAPAEIIVHAEPESNTAVLPRDVRAAVRLNDPSTTPTHSVEPAPPSSMPAPPPSRELIESIDRLLAEAEDAYRTDIISHAPLEVIGRLTTKLRVASAQLQSRFEDVDPKVAAVFEARLTALLNTRYETSFGRHLSISMHELYHSHVAGGGAAAV